MFETCSEWGGLGSCGDGSNFKITCLLTVVVCVGDGGCLKFLLTVSLILEEVLCASVNFVFDCMFSQLSWNTDLCLIYKD